LVALLTLAAGCTPQPTAVEGQLLWDDLKPVAGASLRFVPTTGTQEAVGVTDDQGGFTLTSGARPGAMAGDYKVVVSKYATVNFKPPSPEGPKVGDKAGEDMVKAGKAFGEQAMKGKPPTVKDPVPDIYASDKTTPLTAKVEPGKKIELKISRSK
jgi:hypothetical protein